MIGIERPFTLEQIAEKAGAGFQWIDRRWVLNYQRIMEFLQCTSMHSHHLLDSLSDELHQKVIHSVWEFAISVAKGIINIHNSSEKG